MIESPTTAEQPGSLTITSAVLRSWSACADGYGWFMRRFPQGGEYAAVQAALRSDSRFADERWLTDRAFEHAMDYPATTNTITADCKTEALELIAKTTALTVAVDESDAAQIGSSGYAARINAEGSNPTIAAAGVGTRFRAGAGGAVAVAYNDGSRTRFAVGYVGENLKALTWYSVTERGEFVESGAES